MKEIFISYSSKEYATALKFRNAFADIGIDCWMAPESISVGSNYAVEIPKAIKSCTAVVFVMSEKSQNSVWVQKEIGLAISNNKTIIPIAIDKYPVISPFDFFLTDVQVISDSGDTAQLAAMIAKMTGITATVAEHTEAIASQSESGIVNLRENISDKQDDEKDNTVVSKLSETEQQQKNYEGNKKPIFHNTESDKEAVWFCSSCGTKNNNDYLFCSSCGKNKPVIWFCAECGVQNLGNTKFCYKCNTANPQNKSETVVIAEASKTKSTITSKNKSDNENVWFCTYCGTKNNDDYLFCSSCGKKNEDGNHNLPKTPEADENSSASNNRWLCPICHSLNYESVKYCYRCKFPKKLAHTQTAPKQATAVADKIMAKKNTPTEWTCPKCGTYNSMNVIRCIECGHIK